MQDIFKEQLIKRSPTTADMLKKTGLIISIIIVFLITMMFIGAFAPVITLVYGFLAYIIMGRLKREYEYSFTNGELDIDVIYNKSTRKRLYTGNVKDFEVMAHIDDTSHQNSFATAHERHDYSSGIPSERSYVFLTNYNSKKVSIIIEPNDEMLEAITKMMTRRNFYPKK